MSIQINNASAENFVRQNGQLPVSNGAGWVENMDTAALDDSNLLERAEEFYVRGRWRGREEFSQLLERQAGNETGTVAISGGKLDSGVGNEGHPIPASRPLAKKRPNRQDVIMPPEINNEKLRAFIALHGPILASDKVGWVHKIDRDFPEGILLLDRAREFFVFPTWHTREEFLARLEADVPDIPGNTD